jgi:hypothetical protein
MKIERAGIEDVIGLRAMADIMMLLTTSVQWTLGICGIWI